MRKTTLILVLTLLGSPENPAFAAKLTPVRVGVSDDFLVPELSRNGQPTSQEIYEASLHYAIGENAQNLAKCGYRIEIFKRYYNAKDKLSIFEAGKDFAEHKAWIVFGPRRSDDFLLLKKGSSETVLVSPMANAFAVTSLDPPFFTMYPSTPEFSKAAIAAVRDEKYGTVYGAVVDRSCSACKDFEAEFATQSRFTRKFVEEVDGDSPNLNRVIAQLEANKVDFLLVPNFARVSGYIISRIQDKFPSLKFVGSDAWGGGDYNSFGNFPLKPTTQGLSVRGGWSSEKMSEHFKVPSLALYAVDENIYRPHYSAFMMIDFFRTLSRELCNARPRSRETFLKILAKRAPNHFKPRLSIGIYKLENGKLSFHKGSGK